MLVEFGILSRLLGDSTFEWVARRAVKALWSLRSNNTGLLGNVWGLLCEPASGCAIRPQSLHVSSTFVLLLPLQLFSHVLLVYPGAVLNKWHFGVL